MGGRRSAATATASRTRPGSNIKIVDPDGSNISTLPGAAGDLHPSYSPDGTRVVFEESGDIWTGTTSGSTVFEHLTTTAGTDHEPSWAPDGSLIAFVRSGQLWTMDADGLNPIALSTPGLTVADPSWSPDANFILFAGTTGGHSDIYRIKWDGTGLTNLTNTPSVDEVQPTWQPQALAPTVGTPPSITGTAQVGQTLSGNDGSFNGTMPMFVAERFWQRCNSSGGKLQRHHRCDRRVVFADVRRPGFHARVRRAHAELRR